MTGVDFLRGLAAHLAWMEGKDHGLNGQLAILFCLRNRVAAGWEDGDLGRIIQGAYYFRYSIAQYLIEVPDVRNPEVQQLLGYVEGVFDNTIQDRLTEGATHWNNKLHGSGLAKVAQVGTLNLWK